MRHKWEKTGWGRNLRGRSVRMLTCSSCGLGPLTEGAVKHGGWGFCKPKDGNSAGSSTVATSKRDCIGYCSSCPYTFPECGFKNGVDFRTEEAEP